jgi:hypothetical protein
LPDKVNYLKLTKEVDDWVTLNNPDYRKKHAGGAKGFAFDPMTVRRAFQRLREINRGPQPIEGR